MIYILIFISLTLAAITAFQFLYLFFLGRVEVEHKKRIKELEKHCKELTAKLIEAENQLAAQDELVKTSFEGNDDELWADLISDR